MQTSPINIDFVQKRDACELTGKEGMREEERMNETERNCKSSAEYVYLKLETENTQPQAQKI